MIDLDAWKWLEEIEDFYKPCSIEDCDCDNRHDYAVRKLIACIKEMRDTFEEIYEECDFRQAKPSYSRDSYIWIASKEIRETLTRCAEGKFDEQD